MRRNCNLELSLFHPSHDSNMVDEEVDTSPQGKQHELQRRQEQQELQQLQKLTIFYDGKICVYDVTELQATAILMFANKELEEKVRTPSGSQPSSPILQSNQQLYRATPGLMMKRSLQQFLHKRKNRIQEASPYHH